MSREKLDEEGHEYRPNDENRYDGVPDGISLSITFPNAGLMYSFTQPGRLNEGADWVVLEMDIDPLWAAGTLFCAVNAAKDSGKHVYPGLTGFVKLFVEDPPASSETRAFYHRGDCPTDIQAEVLVKSEISIDHLRRVCVRNESVANEVRKMLQNRPVDVIVNDRIFWPNKVREDMRNEGESY